MWLLHEETPGAQMTSVETQLLCFHAGVHGGRAVNRLHGARGERFVFYIAFVEEKPGIFYRLWWSRHSGVNN